MRKRDCTMISLELFATTATFAFVTSATPGPNNIMLTASGANFGLVRTVPHIAGIILGVALMNICVGLGLGALFSQFPLVQQVLRVAGSAYLLWLAYKLLNFSSIGPSDSSTKRPFGFWQAAAFQYINPKAWIMVISANASFSLTGDDYWLSVAMITLAFVLVGLPSITLWAFFGQYIKRYLSNQRYLKCFNIGMTLLTASCVIFIWMD